MKVVSVEVRDSSGVVYKQVRRENERSSQIIPEALEVAVESEEHSRLPVLIQIEVQHADTNLEAIDGEIVKESPVSNEVVVRDIEHLFELKETGALPESGIVALVQAVQTLESEEAAAKAAQGEVQ